MQLPTDTRNLAGKEALKALKEVIQKHQLHGFQGF
jgi:hypothetical protein